MNPKTNQSGYLVIGVIGSEFANAIKETAETETEERQAEDGQNDDNVVRGHDFFPHHLNEKMTTKFNKRPDSNSC